MSLGGGPVAGKATGALVAYAVGLDGRGRLLCVTLGHEESEESWSELLRQLQDRGLTGVELVIAAEHAGLVAAMRKFLPEARRQRCTVHYVDLRVMPTRRRWARR